MRARYQIREQLYRKREHDSDELRELQLEVLLDIRDVLVRTYNQNVADLRLRIEYDASSPPRTP